MKRDKNIEIDRWNRQCHVICIRNKYDWMIDEIQKKHGKGGKTFEIVTKGAA